LIASGVNPDSKLVEVMEIANHPFFLGNTISSGIKEYRGKTTSFVCGIHQSLHGKKA
jgi:CTP synthase (UTP-ammonia lyase)